MSCLSKSFLLNVLYISPEAVSGVSLRQMERTIRRWRCSNTVTSDVDKAETLRETSEQIVGT